MKRLSDIFFAFLLCIGFSTVIALIGLMVLFTSKGPILHWSKRIGQNNKMFLMPKFRTMQVDTPDVATHLLARPEDWYTPVGWFLRRTSLDELPQLWSIIKGDMSFVGPRPALFNQYDLVKSRTQNNVHKLLPGLTGWAQINGRDQISIEQKVELDAEYMQRQSFFFDLKIVLLTFFRVFRDKTISH